MVNFLQLQRTRKKIKIQLEKEINHYQLQIENVNEKCSQILILKKLKNNSQLSLNLNRQFDNFGQEIGYSTESKIYFEM